MSPADVNNATHQLKKSKLQKNRTIEPLCVTSTFNWKNEYSFPQSTHNVYGFSDSSGDEYEDEEKGKTPVTRSEKMKKLMDSEIDAVCNYFHGILFRTWGDK